MCCISEESAMNFRSRCYFGFCTVRLHNTPFRLQKKSGRTDLKSQRRNIDKNPQFTMMPYSGNHPIQFLSHLLGSSFQKESILYFFPIISSYNLFVLPCVLIHTSLMTSGAPPYLVSDSSVFRMTHFLSQN